MFVASPSAALLHLYFQMSCHNQVRWGTAAPWSTLLSLCLSFVSVPNRARPWKRTSSAGGWTSGKIKGHHECTHVSSPVLPQIPLTEGCPAAGDLIRACLSTCWMKQLGQKSRALGRKGSHSIAGFRHRRFHLWGSSKFHSPSFLSSSAFASLWLVCMGD